MSEDRDNLDPGFYVDSPAADDLDPGFYLDPPPTRARRIDPAELGEEWQAWLATIPPGWGLWAVEA